MLDLWPDRHGLCRVRCGSSRGCGAVSRPSPSLDVSGGGRMTRAFSARVGAVAEYNGVVETTLANPLVNSGTALH